MVKMDEKNKCAIFDADSGLEHFSKHVGEIHCTLALKLKRVGAKARSRLILHLTI